MAIIVNLDVVLAKRKVQSKDVAERIGLSENNLSRIKTGRIKAIRFSTLNALCRELDCKPGDILDYVYDEADEFEDFYNGE
ncbi:helix-turn-helix domain-containing protein [Slackia isoflavoniconvertens]|uniref:helix-turn-helix domain-containing protein n=1 Tax=Slackia isoflavoniconvertens TaxID=572010 RepID=UPI002672ED5D|nr:helix-turn-helix transcriptional regulator [uncultured Adlercreutzia sp.]